MRTCATCGAADNPLGKLRFKKHHGAIYCENHMPDGLDQALPEVASDPLPFGIEASAGSLVVIPCPECRLMSNKPHGRICQGCAGYGSVRIAANNLVVYRPKKETTS